MVSIAVKVGLKGQIVIPKVFRDEYGISPGEEILLNEEDGELVVQKKEQEDPIVVFERLAQLAHKKKTKFALKGWDEKQIEERLQRTIPRVKLARPAKEIPA